MDEQSVRNTLNDLPTTFTRPGPPYTQWIDALTAALTWYTSSVDSLQGQLDFLNATDGWIDVWGTLAGVVRRSNESNAVYLNRIQETILAWRDSAVAITVWIQEIENVSVQVTENLPNLGYSIAFPPSVSNAGIIRILQNLVYVRPAGVPFLTYYITGQMYLNTLNYMAGTPSLSPPLGRVTGAYLGGVSSPVNVSISSSTNNAVALLPSLMFTDPTLNPALA